MELYISICVHNDNPSSVKTMDEKELFIIKTAYKGEV